MSEDSDEPSPWIQRLAAGTVVIAGAVAGMVGFRQGVKRGMEKGKEKKKLIGKKTTTATSKMSKAMSKAEKAEQARVGRLLAKRAFIYSTALSFGLCGTLVGIACFSLDVATPKQFVTKMRGLLNSKNEATPTAKVSAWAKETDIGKFTAEQRAKQRSTNDSEYDQMWDQIVDGTDNQK